MQTIFIADDDAFSREMTTYVLEQAGYTVRCAKDGVEALEMLRKETPHLMILDGDMPRLDGLGVLRTMRGDARWSAVPVFLLTGKEDRETIKKAAVFKVQAYLLKSQFMLEDLLTRVRRQLNEATAPELPAGVEEVWDTPREGD